MSISPPVLLFVYGTLRAGFPHLMAQKLYDHATLIGEGLVQGTLFDLGDYPGLVLENTQNRVVGDLFALPPDDPLLTEIDLYEGCHDSQPHPHEYRRVCVDVHMKDGKIKSAFTYVLNGPIEALKPIESGDYLAYLAS